jgi:hypothetical protein
MRQPIEEVEIRWAVGVRFRRSFAAVKRKENAVLVKFSIPAVCDR